MDIIRDRIDTHFHSSDGFRNDPIHIIYNSGCNTGSDISNGMVLEIRVTRVTCKIVNGIRVAIIEVGR